MQPHEKQDQEPDSPKRKKPDPRDTQAKWLLFAIAILLGMITAQIIKRLVETASHGRSAVRDRAHDATIATMRCRPLRAIDLRAVGRSGTFPTGRRFPGSPRAVRAFSLDRKIPIVFAAL